MPMHPTIEQVRAAVGVTENALTKLGAHVEPAEPVEISGLPFFRHREYSDLLFSYMKCVQAVSVLNACLALYDAGYAYEVNTLCRIADECMQDILFQAKDETGNGLPTDDQKQMIEVFFQEEFTDPRNPVGTSKARAMVPRKKVHALIARAGSPENPSGFQAVQQALHRAFSGFVHGTYGHIMDLYAGPARGFNLRGAQGAPRLQGALESLASSTYRIMGAVGITAARYQANAIHAEVAAAARRFYTDAELGD